MRTALIAGLLTVAFAGHAQADEGVRLSAAPVSYDVGGADDAGMVQTTPNFQLGQPLTARWDASTNEAASATVRYDVRLDASGAVSVAPVGQASYSFNLPQPQLTPGAHVVGVKACSVTECSPEATYAFNVIRATPLTPSNLTVTPVAALALNRRQGEAYADAYGQWAIDRGLSRSEYGLVEQRHTALFPNTPATKWTLLATLEAMYAELAARP